MTSEFKAVFERLRSILNTHAGAFVVSEDSATRFCLSAPVGAATLRAWRGKRKSEMIPVAWTEVGKAYVSFHHMALYGSPKLREGLSEELSRRMQGKTCFNFRTEKEIPVSELEELTARGCEGMRAAGFIR
jgi:hypothetical protein